MEYGEFSKVYDQLMEDYPYQQIFEYIKEIFTRKHIEPRTLLEIACGTGSLTQYVKQLCPVVAFDKSEDMLSVARMILGSSPRVRLY